MANHVLAVAREVLAMMIAISMILLFVGIAVLILIHVCIVGRAYRRGIGSTNIIERNSIRSNSMSHEDIEKLPCYAFQQKYKGSSPVECAVCLDHLKVGEKCRLLPQCNHSFHAQCVDLWLLKTSICPICRATADSSSRGESSRYSESGRHELNMEIVDTSDMILVPESVNDLSFATTENRTSDESGIRELNAERDDLAGMPLDHTSLESTDSNNIELVPGNACSIRRNGTAQNSEQLSGVVSTDGQTSGVNVDSSEITSDMRVSQEESIHLVHEQVLQERDEQTA